MSRTRGFGARNRLVSLRFALVFITSAGLFLSGCGVATVTVPRAVSSGDGVIQLPNENGAIAATAITDSVSVYFLFDGRLKAVSRTITLPSDATDIDIRDSALRELRKGPNEKELAAGYSSSFDVLAPAGSGEASVSRVENGEAVVGLNVESISTNPPDRGMKAIAQLVYTVIKSHPGVGGVRLIYFDKPVSEGGSGKGFVPFPQVPLEGRTTQGAIYLDDFRCLGGGVCPILSPNGTSIVAE
jgi:hypothetical protein